MAHKAPTMPSCAFSGGGIEIYWYCPKIANWQEMEKNRALFSASRFTIKKSSFSAAGYRELSKMRNQHGKEASPGRRFFISQNLARKEVKA